MNFNTPPALPAPYDQPPQPNGPDVSADLQHLVDTQVKALVASAPAMAEFPSADRSKLEDRVVRIAAHAAMLALDDWQLSKKLGQRPLLKTSETLHPEQANDQSDTTSAGASALATTLAGSGFQQDATSRVGAVTRSTLRAISFPTFVADLIKGTFSAILDATTTQMGAFMEMLESVSKTVEQFENENITDAQAHSWLAEQFPQHIRLQQTANGSAAVPTDAAEESTPPGIKGILNLPDQVDSIDDVTIEEVLVPAARRKLAQSRLQMLSSLVMLGLQRIVINHGRIRATMGFHIDATDSASREDASLTDVSLAAQAQVGFGMWSASARTSVTYVRSSKSNSDAELNVNADLTGEVDLTFSTDYMPLNRMATTENIAQIRSNTPVPSENYPTAATGVATAAEVASPGASQVITARMEGRENLTAPELPPLTQADSAEEEETEEVAAAESSATESAPTEDATTEADADSTATASSATSWAVA